MKIYYNPNKTQWSTLAERPALNAQDLGAVVQAVFQDVASEGDKALRKYTEKFDKVRLEKLRAEETEIQAASTQLSERLKAAIQLAKGNITKFHQAQAGTKEILETTPGVRCWRENRPIEKVGIYIPGGSAPLFSTVLMLGIPAKLAGCKEIVLCTPPDREGNINPAILYAAAQVGITQVVKLGGIQAIAALTLGTTSVPKVDKIFGPGNQYVTAAKQYALAQGTSIDMPAGPSEVLVIADETCDPAFVAADLLSQAEHGADSQVILLSNSKQVIEDTQKEVQTQLQALPRKEIAAKALENSKAISFESLQECLTFSNLYAPEHLIIATKNCQELIPNISNAGSVFLGNYSCESAGDYASGTNHTLPTNGFAKSYSGVSLDSFVKKITFQELSIEGIKNIGPAIEAMAEAEELIAHKNAVTIRLDTIGKMNQ